jgi:DNA gyrase subunit A
VQKRGGMGNLTLDVTERSGPLVAAKEMLDGDELMVISASGASSRVPAAAVPVQGRSTQGRSVLKLTPGDRIVEVARVAHDRGEDGAPASGNVEVSEVDEVQLELMRSRRN